MFSQQGFVCRYHMFSPFNSLEKEFFGRVVTTNQFDEHINVGMVNHLIGRNRQHIGRKFNSPVSRNIQISHFNQLHLDSQPFFYDSSVFRKDFSYTGTDGAKADHSHLNRFHRLTSSVKKSLEFRGPPVESCAHFRPARTVQNGPRLLQIRFQAQRPLWLVPEVICKTPGTPFS